MMASADVVQDQQIEKCDLCQKQSCFFCRGCRVSLCDHCVSIHLRVKSKNVHVIVDYASKDDDDTGFCESHPQNQCSAYCKNCDVPICILCTSIKHKSHEIFELSDKIEELLKVITRENERLQSFKHELKNILDHTTILLSSLPHFYKQRKDDIAARGEEWHKQIENTVKKLHQELDEMQKGHEDVLNKQKKEFEDMIRSIDEINRKSTYLQKSHDVKKMQTFIPVIKKQETLSEVSQYSFPTFCEFKIDANYFQTYFGYVERVQEKKVLISDRKLREDEVSITKILEVPTVTSDIYTGFTDSEEYKSCLFDMAVTDENKVWIGGNSRVLKLFDLKGNVHHTVSITGLGAYFCMYNQHVIYSAFKAIKMVSDVNTDETMFSTNDWDPRGVTSTVSGDLLVCLRKDDLSKVVRYSISGSVLQEIQYDSQCQPLYKAATYITENVNGDIVVTDVKKRAVIAADRLGFLKYSYLGNNKTFLACSVAHDSLGNIIVTDYNGDKLHMLDRDGKFLMYIIPEEEIEKPRGLCILDHGEMMVGECMSGIAKIIKYLDD